MKKMKLATLIIALAGLSASTASAVTIDVYPWIAPNAAGSASWAPAETNALYAMSHNLSAYGDLNSPSYFHVQSNVTGAQVLVTSFHSWLGQADPGAVFGPAFANELGNRAHFALRIDGQGTQFSISHLSFVMASTDPTDRLGYSYPSGYQYGSGYQGVLKGGDGILWTADDTFVTSGPDTQLVDGLVGRGSGNAYWPCGPGDVRPCSTIAEQQAALNGSAAYPGYAYTFTGTYTLGALATGSATFNITPVPEPETYAMMGVGLAILGWVGRRRKQQG